MQPDILFELNDYLSVASHKPGKLVLKITMSIAVHPAVRGYIKQNGFAPPKGLVMRGLEKTQFNPLTRKLTVLYNPECINPRTLARLLYAENAETFVENLRELSRVMECDLLSILPDIVIPEKAA